MPFSFIDRHRRSQGVHWVHVRPPPSAEKKFCAKFTGGKFKCTPGKARVHFFEEIGEIWTVGASTFWWKKSAPPEKFPATPMLTDALPYG